MHRSIKAKITIDSGIIEYWHAGKGKSLIFLHGGSVSYRSYLPFLQSLSRYFSVYAPAMPGAGHSMSAKNLTLTDFADTMQKFCLQLNLEKPILCGHSFGGLVALALKNKFSDYFANLVLFAPAGLSIDQPKDTFKYIIRKKFTSLIRGPLYQKEDILLNAAKHFKDSKYIGNLALGNDYFDTHHIKHLTQKVTLFWALNDHIFDLNYARKYSAHFANKQVYYLPGQHGMLNPQKHKIIEIIKALAR